MVNPGEWLKFVGQSSTLASGPLGAGNQHGLYISWAFPVISQSFCRVTQRATLHGCQLDSGGLDLLGMGFPDQFSSLFRILPINGAHSVLSGLL